MQIDQDERILKVFGARENWEHAKSFHESVQRNQFIDPGPRYSSQRVESRGRCSQDFAKDSIRSNPRRAVFQTFAEQHDTFQSYGI